MSKCNLCCSDKTIMNLSNANSKKHDTNQLKLRKFYCVIQNGQMQVNHTRTACLSGCTCFIANCFILTSDNDDFAITALNLSEQLQTGNNMVRQTNCLNMEITKSKRNLLYNNWYLPTKIIRCMRFLRKHCSKYILLMSYFARSLFVRFKTFFVVSV